MSSYIERLDRKETIKKAKQRMKHFSELYLLLCAGYSIPAVSYGERHTNGSFYNHSQQLLHQIEVKDERYDEFRDILDAIACLPKKEAEILFLKHVAMLDIEKIANIIGYSVFFSYKTLRQSYFHLAICLNIQEEKQLTKKQTKN